MIKGLACLLGVVMMFVAGAAMARTADKDDKAAVVAAEKWLAGVDAGNYAEGWKAAAAYLKNAVTEEQLARSLQAARKPLGKLLSRKIQDKTFMTTMPGAPDGDYVMIQFATSFASKAEAVETVTAMLDKDGEWRVAGYFIN